MIRTRTSITAALVAVTALCGGGPVGAQPVKEIMGVVQEVDAVVGTITVYVEQGLGINPKSERVKTFNLARPDLPVRDADGNPLKLEGLAADQRIFLQLDM